MRQKTQKSDEYHIHILGHLDPQWSDWFEHMTLTHNADGTTTLTGTVVDQAALYGLLDKLRDLGLQLIAVSRMGSDVEESL
ncbi:MAG: hypothetical protein JXR84_23240 [Anaerolineae bacterium]|nr:hypothetical protein [Anaerolineae bacterium]